MSGPAEAAGSAVLEQWDGWLQNCTDRLFDLEGRAAGSGSDADRADVAAAFVARKAIDERVAEMRAAPAEQYGAIAARPIADGFGGPVGTDLADAARLVEAIIDAVDTRLGRTERQAMSDAAAQAAIDADLDVSARLADTLDTEENVVADLRRAMARGEDLRPLAVKAGALRQRLESADRQRRAAFAEWDGLPARLSALAQLHQRASRSAEICREKIADAAPLAVPDPAVLDQPKPLADLRAMTWPAARPHMQGLLRQVERLEAAMQVAVEHFEAPLGERDELRGLLQAFGRKAAATGGAEDPALAPLYKRAEAELWSAPCNVGRARQMVHAYIEAVNGRISGVER